MLVCEDVSVAVNGSGALTAAMAWSKAFNALCSAVKLVLCEFSVANAEPTVPLALSSLLLTESTLLPTLAIAAKVPLGSPSNEAANFLGSCTRLPSG